MRISDWSSDVCSSDLIVDLEARLVVARLEADVVEHEEFGLGSDIDGVADAGRGDIGFGALRRGARVAGIALAGRGLDDVAEDAEHRRRREGVVIYPVEVGLPDHVRLVDRLPALDRRPAAPQPVLQRIPTAYAGTPDHNMTLSLW